MRVNEKDTADRLSLGLQDRFGARIAVSSRKQARTVARTRESASTSVGQLAPVLYKEIP